MRQVIYADVLFLMNMLVCGFVLLASERLLRHHVPRFRLLLGTVFSGAYSMTIFLPKLPLPFLCQLLSIAIICLVTFGFGDKKKYFRALLCTLLVNFIFAGIMLAIWLLAEPDGMLWQNGVVYFDVSFLFLAVVSALCYAIIFVWSKLSARRLPENCSFRVKIVFRDREVTADALLDSGNLLKDSFTGKPVTVISKELADKLLGGQNELSIDKLSPGLRLIPCRTVGNEGLMTAFTAEKMLVFDGKKSLKFENCVIGIAEGKIEKGECEVLLNAELLDENGKAVKIVVG